MDIDGDNILLRLRHGVRQEIYQVAGRHFPEEVARLMGYENFEFTAPTVVLEKAINQRTPDMERDLREYLAFRCGMQEIFTYPWTEDEYISAAGCDAAEMLTLSTAPDESHLRFWFPDFLKALSHKFKIL